MTAAPTEPPAKRTTYCGDPHVAAACLRGWAASIAEDAAGNPELLADLAADLRGAAAVLEPVASGPDAGTARRVAADAIRAELADVTVLSEVAQNALAGRLGRVAADAIERARTVQ